ncbi:MAG TPA: PIN domain-containing protein [Rhizomicrobium sp.]
MVLIDTNILLDIVSEDAVWAERSWRALLLAGARDSIAINEVVYAELSVGYERPDELGAFLASFTVGLVRIPTEGLFLAGRAYRDYRKKAGTKSGVLPDFFIGAHAAVAGAPLVTRDTKRIRNYFPTVQIIEP